MPGASMGPRVLAIMLLLSVFVNAVEAAAMDYNLALEKAVLYFDAQKSGKLGAGNRVSWRGDSGLSDGSAQGVDLTGGYYDAGDNVKYGLPMAFTITMLSWGAIEYRSQLQAAGQLGHTMDAIKWGTDYFIKAHTEPNVLWGEVGDGDSDHACWMRPEDMTTPRTAYKIDANNPGSDLAGETAAAMAAASIVFKASNPAYSSTLLSHAKQLFTFADTYRGTYDSAIPVAGAFYKSWSGFNDELLWGAIWLYEATGDDAYLAYVANNAQTLGGTGWALDQFSWDNKYVGVQLLATKILFEGRGNAYKSTLEAYRSKAEYFLCAALQKNSGGNIKQSPSGMYWIQSWNNMQYVTTAAFLLTLASDIYESAHQQPQSCTSPVANADLLAAGKKQVDYVLGANNRGLSYMVGYSSNFPQRVHHRAASISSPVSCSDGFNIYYYASSGNPHVIHGAIVGGPDANDMYDDRRDNYEMAEAATYNTAPMVGTLARLSKGAKTKLPDTNSLEVTPYDAVVTSSSHLPGGDSTTTAYTDSTHQSQQTRSPHLTRRKYSFDGSKCITISQQLTHKWRIRNKPNKVYYKNEGKITNNCTQVVAGTTFVVHDLYGALYGLTKKQRNGNIYTLPDSAVMLQVGESLVFSYMQERGFPAKIFVREGCPSCANREH